MKKYIKSLMFVLGGLVCGFCSYYSATYVPFERNGSFWGAVLACVGICLVLYGVVRNSILSNGE
jgi:hypothetical protein